MECRVGEWMMYKKYFRQMMEEDTKVVSLHLKVDWLMAPIYCYLI